MRVSLRLIRHRGRPLRQRNIISEPAVDGDLTTYHQTYGEGGPYHVAAFKPAGAAPADHNGLLLYEPVMVQIAASGFRLRGFERLPKGEAVVQEWDCSVLQYVVRESAILKELPGILGSRSPGG